jgi:hypothetical protein
MYVRQLNHFTLRCRPHDLPGLKAFCCAVLGLAEGPRPAFGFDGHWLYSEGQPIVHLAQRMTAAAPTLRPRPVRFVADRRATAAA